MEALFLKDSEAPLLQLGRDSDHSEETLWTAVRKDCHLKIRKDREEVIQAESKPRSNIWVSE